MDVIKGMILFKKEKEKEKENNSNYYELYKKIEQEKKNDLEKINVNKEKHSDVPNLISHPVYSRYFPISSKNRMKLFSFSFFPERVTNSFIYLKSSFKMQLDDDHND